jgi:hypothetical protein
MCRVIVPEFHDTRMSFQRRLYDAALNAPSAPVHDPYFSKPGGCRHCYVFFNDRRNVPWIERMEIQLRVNG